MWERYEYEDGWDWKCPKCGNLQTFRTKRCQKCGEIIGEGIEERGIHDSKGVIGDDMKGENDGKTSIES